MHFIGNRVPFGTQSSAYLPFVCERDHVDPTVLSPFVLLESVLSQFTPARSHLLSAMSSLPDIISCVSLSYNSLVISNCYKIVRTFMMSYSRPHNRLWLLFNPNHFKETVIRHKGPCKSYNAL